MKARLVLPSIILAGLVLAFLDLVWLDTYRYPIAMPDFFVYYRAAQIGQAHGWIAMYDPSVFLPAIRDVLNRPLPYLNPPQLAWLVIPLSWLPYSAAAWIWRGILGSALVLTCFLAAPGKGRTRLLHGTAVALLLPVFISFAFGQVSLIITAALAMSWWLIRQDRPWLAGIVLALTILKPQAAFLVPLALLTAGYWQVFLSWLGASLMMAGVGLLAVGPSVFSKAAESIAIAQGVPGPVQMSLERQFPLPLALIAISAMLATAALVAWRTRSHGPSIPLAAGIVVSMLASPYMNFYDLSAVVLAGWLVLQTSPPRWQASMTYAMYLPLYLAPVLPSLTAVCAAAWLLSLLRLPPPATFVAETELAA